MDKSTLTNVSIRYFNRQIERGVDRTGDWPDKVSFPLRKIPTEVAHAFYLKCESERYKKPGKDSKIGITDVIVQLIHHYTEGNLVDMSQNIFENGIFGNVTPIKRRPKPKSSQIKESLKKAPRGQEELRGRKPKNQTSLLGGFEETKTNLNPGEAIE